MITSINNISLGEVISSKVTKVPYVVRKIHINGIVDIAPVFSISRRHSIWIENLVDWKSQESP